MKDLPTGEITRLLHRVGKGDEVALNELAVLVYWNVRQLARAKLSHEKRGHLLQPTALANEALLRLLKMDRIQLVNRNHLYATVATVMRNVLVDYARKNHGVTKEALRESMVGDAVDAHTLLVIHESLDQLEAEDAHAARIFELRWFAGMPVQEIADELGVSTKTVQRKFIFARSWLSHRLRAAPGAG